MEYHLQNIYVPISETRTVQLSVDGDCKIQNLIRQFAQEAEKDGEAKHFEIELYYDQAHLAKNVPKNVNAIVKSHKFMGDGNGRIGKRNLYRLINAIQVAIKKCCKVTSKLPSKEQRDDPEMKLWVETQMNIVKKHAAGDHSSCESNGENCSDSSILRVYPGKFSGIVKFIVFSNINIVFLFSNVVF